MKLIGNQQLHSEIEHHFAQQRPEPPFTDEMVHQTQFSINHILASNNVQAN